MFTMGQKVQFNVCYSRKCSERFHAEDFKTNTWKLRPLKVGLREGFIVGLRRVIMDNYKFHFGTQDVDSVEPNYSDGTRETVLLVAEHPYKEPVIVRSSDVQII